MLIPNGLPARASMKIRARVLGRALASDPEEGSIAPLIVGMLALLLLIGSVTVAIDGRVSADSAPGRIWLTLRPNSITRTIRTP